MAPQKQKKLTPTPQFWKPLAASNGQVMNAVGNTFLINIFWIGITCRQINNIHTRCVPSAAPFSCDGGGTGVWKASLNHLPFLEFLQILFQDIHLRDLNTFPYAVAEQQI